MPSVLLLVKKFSIDGSTPWLTGDLVDGLLLRGYDVDIILLDLSGELEKKTYLFETGVRVFCFPVSNKGSSKKLFSFIISYFSIFWLCIFGSLKKEYAFLIGFSIASVFNAIVPVVCFTKSIGKSIMFLWDFFPLHQYEIGKIRNPLVYTVLKKIEKMNIYTYDAVLLMSKFNLDFFKTLYPDYTGSLHIVPVWGKDRTDDFKESCLKLSKGKLNIVFGGQLARGRGVEQILQISKIIDSLGMEVDIHLFGSGELELMVDEFIKEEDIQSLKKWGTVSRLEYLSVLRSADVGLVITQPGVNVPTFPSKVIDYFVSKKPVLACVEKATDFGFIIEHIAKAGLAVEAGDNIALIKAIEKFLQMKQSTGLSELGINGNIYFKNNMQINVVVEKIEKEVLMSVGTGEKV